MQPTGTLHCQWSMQLFLGPVWIQIGTSSRNLSTTIKYNLLYASIQCFCVIMYVFYTYALFLFFEVRCSCHLVRVGQYLYVASGFRGFRGSQCEIDCGCGHHGQCNSKNVPWCMVKRNFVEVVGRWGQVTTRGGIKKSERFQDVESLNHHGGSSFLGVFRCQVVFVWNVCFSWGSLYFRCMITHGVLRFSVWGMYLWQRLAQGRVNRLRVGLWHCRHLGMYRSRPAW